jgi:hypothetical protein
MITCPGCGSKIDLDHLGEWCMGAYQCPFPDCGILMDQEGTYLQPKPEKNHWGK